MPTNPQRRHRIVLLALGAAAALAVVILAAALFAAGGSSGDTPAEAAVTARPSGGFAGGVLTTPKPAPALVLRDSTGQLVDLSTDRGTKAMFVTFLYTRCPDVCPLTTDNWRSARAKLTPAQRAKVGMVAVSVDPENDTPAAVNKFLARHRVTGQMDYLVGSAAELAPVWKRWGVAAAADTTDPDFVAHSALIYGVGASGDIQTVYSWDAPPADLVHDVPLLLKS